MDIGLGLPKLELSVKKKKSQESPGQGDVTLSVVCPGENGANVTSQP